MSTAPIISIAPSCIKQEIARELAIRKNTYPKLIKRGRLTSNMANRNYLRLKAALPYISVIDRGHKMFPGLCEKLGQGYNESLGVFNTLMANSDNPTERKAMAMAIACITTMAEGFFLVQQATNKDPF